MAVDVSKSAQHIVRGLTRTFASVSVDPAAQAGAGVFSADVTVTGVNRGDIVFAIPPATLEANLKLVGAHVHAANTVRLVLQALAAVDGAALTWDFIVLDRT